MGIYFMKYIRSLIILSLILILFWFIYLSFEKLLEEDTKARIYHQDDGADLPSVTICLKWLNKTVKHTKPQFEGRDLALPISDDWNFDDYMTKSYLVKDIISRATFYDQPGDKLE